MNELEPVEYRIELTALALEMLAEVNDQRHRQGLTNRIEIKSEPEKQGKPLGDILKGCWSEIPNYLQSRP